MDRNIQSLTQIFGKFSGQTILNPNRMTCDVDMVLEEIRAEAEQHGLDVLVEYPGAQNIPDSRQDRLRVELNNDRGTYKVRDFRIG